MYTVLYITLSNMTSFNIQLSINKAMLTFVYLSKSINTNRSYYDIIKTIRKASALLIN